MREVYIWSKLNHVNIQRLLGIIVFQGGLGMLSPWMEQGDLKRYLLAHPNVGRYPLVRLFHHVKATISHLDAVRSGNYRCGVPPQHPNGKLLFA